VKLNSMFLRRGCLLPDGLRVEQKQFNQGWMSAGDTTSTALDLAVRRAGWHFMWVETPASGFACRRTEASAANHAIARALRHSSREFNAAELVSIRVSKCPDLRVARVTVQARQIQQDTALSAVDQTALRQLSRG